MKMKEHLRLQVCDSFFRKYLLLIFPLLTVSTDSVRSLSNRGIDHTSNTTPVIFQTSTEQTYNERINRLTPSKRRFNMSTTSNYDPSKSPLFSVGNRVSHISHIKNRKTKSLFYTFVSVIK
jgi:hypothetical protein